MDGMAEACVKGGVEACYASVSCACALLAALDQLLQGHGLQPEQVRPLLGFCPLGLLSSGSAGVQLGSSCPQAQLLLRRRDDLRDGSESTRESMELNEADFRWQRQVLSSEHPPGDPQGAYQGDPQASTANMAASERSPDISISITTETGQTTTDLEGGDHILGHTIPDGGRSQLPSPSFCRNQQGGKCVVLGPGSEHQEEGGTSGIDEKEREKRRASGGGGEGGGVVPPDVVQRSHALVYPDITNFLSVESRNRSHHGGGSRYSESTFRWDWLAS